MPYMKSMRFLLLGTQSTLKAPYNDVLKEMKYSFLSKIYASIAYLQIFLFGLINALFVLGIKKKSLLLLFL
jgi:hypothetical protein